MPPCGGLLIEQRNQPPSTPSPERHRYERHRVRGPAGRARPVCSTGAPSVVRVGVGNGRSPGSRVWRPTPGLPGGTRPPVARSDAGFPPTVAGAAKDWADTALPCSLSRPRMGNHCEIRLCQARPKVQPASGRGAGRRPYERRRELRGVEATEAAVCVSCLPCRGLIRSAARRGQATEPPRNLARRIPHFMSYGLASLSRTRCSMSSMCHVKQIGGGDGA